MIRLIAATAFVLLSVACNRKAMPPQPAAASEAVVETSTPQTSDTILYYFRGACFGMCPMFELTVWKDGKAVYVGKNHVDRIGRFQSQISYSDIQHV